MFKSIYTKGNNMNILVILLASQGSSEYNEANLVFQDLFTQVNPEIIYAIRTDSQKTLPDSLANNEAIYPILMPSIINEDFNSGSQDPDNYWADYLQQIIEELPINSQNLDVNIHVNGGDFWITSAMISLGKIYDSKLWLTVKKDDQWIAKEVTPIQSNSDDEKAIVSHLCTLSIKKPSKSFTANDLQESNLVPSSKGIENSLRNPISLGLVIKEKVDIGKSNQSIVSYKITPLGILHGISWNIEKIENSTFNSIKDSVLMIQRITNSDEDLDNYIIEHGLSKFTAASLLIVDFDSTYNAEVKKSEFQEVLNKNWPNDSISNDILTNIEFGNSEEGMSEFMKIIHKIITSKDYDWTILSTGIPAALRPWMIEYSLQKRLTIKHILRRIKPISNSSRGSIIYDSGLPKSQHLLSIPSLDSLEIIKHGINKDIKWFKESLVTLLLAEKEEVRIGRTGGGIIEYNNKILTSDHNFYIGQKKEIPATHRNIHKSLAKAKLIQVYSDENIAAGFYQLTPEGKVTASIILNQGTDE